MRERDSYVECLTETQVKKMWFFLMSRHWRKGIPVYKPKTRCHKAQRERDRREERKRDSSFVEVTATKQKVVFFDDLRKQKKGETFFFDDLEG